MTSRLDVLTRGFRAAYLNYDALTAQLHSWREIVTARLPFASGVVTSSDDPYCSESRAAQLAAAWGSVHGSIGAAGHINGDTGLGDWPAGHALLESLLADVAAAEPGTSRPQQQAR